MNARAACPIRHRRAAGRALVLAVGVSCATLVTWLVAGPTAAPRTPGRVEPLLAPRADRARASVFDAVGQRHRAREMHTGPRAVPGDVAELRIALRSTDPGVLRAALTRLAAIGPRAHSALSAVEKLRGSDDARIRRLAIRATAELRSSPARPEAAGPAPRRAP